MKFMFGLQHPLTCKPWTTLSNPCNKVGEVNIFLKSFLRLPSCVVYSCICLWYCVVVMLHEHVNDYITVVSSINKANFKKKQFVLVCFGFLAHQQLLVINAKSIFMHIVGDLSRGWSEGSLFNSYYIEV